MRAWPGGIQLEEYRSPGQSAQPSLLFRVGGRQNKGTSDGRARQFALELDKSFPFLHVLTLAPASVSVSVSNTPCLSQTTKVPAVIGMQFGIGIGPSGGNGVCNTNAGPGNQFVSNPPVSPPPINIGEPAPNSPEVGCGGCGECAQCGGCSCNCGCDCNCGSCSPTGFCDGGN